jgi:predicted DNA-binding transcriptional regulator AlpA
VSITPPLAAGFGQAPDEYLATPDEISALLNISLRSLEARRSASEPPPFVKLGRSVRYPAGAVRAWIQSLLRTGADPDRAPGQAHQAPSTPAPRPVIALDRWGYRFDDPSLGLDEPIARGGRPRAAPKHDNFSAFLASASPEDEWPFVRAGEYRRPVDLVEWWRQGVEMPDDADLVWLSLQDYTSALINAARAQDTAERLRSSMADTLPPELDGNTGRRPGL